MEYELRNLAQIVRKEKENQFNRDDGGREKTK